VEFSDLKYDFFRDMLPWVDHQGRLHPAHRYRDSQEWKLKEADKKVVKLSRSLFSKKSI
jgi:hypothetical protein